MNKDERPELPENLYWRDDSPHIGLCYYDEHGERRQRSSGTGDVKKALAVLVRINREVRAIKESGLAAGPLTVARYAAKWIADRRARALPSVDDEEMWLDHALGTRLDGAAFGDMLLKEVRTRHLRNLIRALESKVLTRKRHGGQEEYRLATRSVLHIYSKLRMLFREAFVDELIPASPAVLDARKQELPSKVDKDPEWRAGAVYDRAEVERLLSDERIPLRQRVVHGLEFLCGVRINEVTPRRWRDYDATVEPLGRLTFSTAYSLKKKHVKGTKTNTARQVPVHPTLAKLLAQWKLSGWAEVYGRAPGPEDLLVPALPHRQRRRTPEKAALCFLNSTTELAKLHEALALLGLRKRGQHDARATFMSLAVEDGGREEVLKSVTHAKGKDVRSGYLRFPWRVTCEEVAKLNIQLREPKVLRLASGGGGGGDGQGPETTTPTPASAALPVTLLLRSPEPTATTGETMCPGRDSNPEEIGARGREEGAEARWFGWIEASGVSAAPQGARRCNTVTTDWPRALGLRVVPPEGEP